MLLHMQGMIPRKVAFALRAPACRIIIYSANGRKLTMISLRNIEKYFEHGPTKTFVLRRINVDIKEGEFISIMGPSGAGKSTLLHLLGMHDSAWTGEYHLLDHAIHKINKKDRMEIYKKYFGFVFQSYHLL